MRELMRDFVQRQKQARDYDAFLNSKVSQARADIEAGNYSNAEEVEARFAARRAQLQAKVSNPYP
jgi:hypothetical protein